MEGRKGRRKIRNKSLAYISLILRITANFHDPDCVKVLFSLTIRSDVLHFKGMNLLLLFNPLNHSLFVSSALTRTLHRVCICGLRIILGIK